MIVMSHKEWSYHFLVILIYVEHFFGKETHKPTHPPTQPKATIIFHSTAIYLQILWTYSIYLEAGAILPQLFMMSKTGEAETITRYILHSLL